MRRVFIAVGTVAVMALGAVSLSAWPPVEGETHYPWHSLGPCMTQDNPIGFCQWSCVMVGHNGADSCCGGTPNYCHCTD